DDREENALVGRGRRDVGVEAGRMVSRVDREHGDERREGEERPLVFAQPVASVAGGHVSQAECGARVAGASAPILSALLTNARSVTSPPISSRLIAPSYITSTRSQQPTSSS